MSEEISHWIELVKAGDPQGLEEIWRSYFARLSHLARKRLPAQQMRAVDEEDIALSALKSFYNGVQARRFPDLHDREDLWKVLAAIASRKVSAHQRREMADKRGGGRTQSQDVLVSPEQSSVDGIGNVPGRTPQPDDEIAFSDTFEALLAALDDDKLRETALLKLAGGTVQEISDHMGFTTRTIERWLQQIRKVWSESDLLDAQAPEQS